MFFNTKTIKAITLLLSFVTKSSSTASFQGNVNKAHARKLEEECGCSIDALIGDTIECDVSGDNSFSASIPEFGTEGSSFTYSYGLVLYTYDSERSEGEEVPLYTRTINENEFLHYKFDMKPSLSDGECELKFYSFSGGSTYNYFYDFWIGCWACPRPPSPSPTLTPTNSPSDSPSLENEEDNNDENNNESDDENEEDEENEEDNEDDEENDEENDDGCCCCCEEKEVESSLLWTIKNVLVLGN